ncbi:hypothetical protein N0754_17845 [Pseudomonas aeruginosa]|nr:hypothetical protein [Pseudomonas aeruginosa]MCS9764095.1 hypothetical protein [Pseudomonas aeruginosa]MCS9820272.1 hypothetical protein [Pseudomonas aeruginosa]MCT0240853.1 hypothetical protein [Pseudomonas aeruginosa]MCT0528305.1 hypothetical protein [Pseudomonas aeruginosa]
MPAQNIDHQSLFVSSLMSRYDCGHHYMRERLLSAYGPTSSAIGTEEDREAIKVRLAQDFEQGERRSAVFQAQYEFVTGQLDGQLQFVCQQMDGERLAAEYDSYAEFEEDWLTLNHYDLADEEPTEDEMEVALEDLSKCYEVLTLPSATYDIVMARYRSILDENPTSALLIGQGMAAVLVADPEGTPYVIGVHLEEDGSVSQHEVEHGGFDFDARSFSDAGSWDGCSVEETVLTFLRPELLPLQWLSQAQETKPTSAPRMG